MALSYRKGDAVAVRILPRGDIFAGVVARSYRGVVSVYVSELGVVEMRPGDAEVVRRIERGEQVGRPTSSERGVFEGTYYDRILGWTFHVRWSESVDLSEEEQIVVSSERLE